MRIFILALIFLFLVLQYEFWLAPGSVMTAWRLRHRVVVQQQENNQLKQRNAAIAADIADLKSGNNAVEERARMDLGMVKKGESFYQVIKHD